MFRDRDGWRVSWYRHGKRRSKKFANEKEARLFELKLELGEADTTPNPRLSPTFEELARDWHENYCKRRKSETQWGHDLIVIEKHLIPVLGPMRLTTIKKSAATTLLEALQSTKRGERYISARTCNNALGLAKTILGYSVEKDLLSLNPFSSVPLLLQKKPAVSYWTPEERDGFLAQAFLLDPEFANLVLVACYTGLRMGELAGLRRRDLDFKTGLIHVGASYSVKLRKDLRTTKNGEAGWVEMCKPVHEVLSACRFLPTDARVFQLSLFDNARRRLLRLCELTQTRPIRFHDLRHTFASSLAMAGVDLMKIQAACRHKSYAMTLRYAHLHPDHLRGITTALEKSGSQTARSESHGRKS